MRILRYKLIGLVLLLLVNIEIFSAQRFANTWTGTSPKADSHRGVVVQKNIKIALLREDFELWKKIRELKEAKDWKKLIPLVEKSLSGANDEKFAELNLILAQAYIAKEEWGSALEHLQKAKTDELKALWNYHRIQIHLSQGQSLQSVNLLENFNKTDKRYFIRKLGTWIEKYFVPRERHDVLYDFINQAQKSFPELLENYGTASLYKSVLESKGEGVPIEIIRNMWRYPKNLNAVLQTDRLSILQQGSLAIFTPEEHVQRIKHLKNLPLAHPQDFEKIQVFIDSYLKSLKNCGQRKGCEKIGEWYLERLFARKDYDEIVDLIESGKIEKHYGVPQESQLFYLIRVHQRKIDEYYEISGKLAQKIQPTARRTEQLIEELLDQYPRSSKELLKMYPQSFLPLKAMSKMAEVYNIIGMTEKADIWWEKIIKKYASSKRYKERIEVDEAYWRRMWTYIEQEDWPNALKQAKQAERYPVYELENAARMDYWSGWLYRRIGDSKRSEVIWKKLLQKRPNTFYGLVLKQERPDLSPRSDSPSKTNACSSSSAFSVAQQARLKYWQILLKIGEGEQAKWEIETQRRARKIKGCFYKVSIIELLYEFQHFSEASRLAQYYFNGKLATLYSQTSKVWKFSYPKAYWSELERQVGKSGVDYYFIHALMRRESRFKKHAISRAGAVGVLQIIEPTARQTAAKHGIELSRFDELLNPSVSLLIGSSYLSDLKREFKADHMAIGAYNAGGPKMYEWLEKFGNGTSELEFIEKIPYNHTRSFIKNVLMDYYLYQRIYQ